MARKLCAAEPIPEGIIEEGYSLAAPASSWANKFFKEVSGRGVYRHVHNKCELSCTTRVLSIATTNLKDILELSNRVVNVYILKFSYPPSKYTAILLPSILDSQTLKWFKIIQKPCVKRSLNSKFRISDELHLKQNSRIYTCDKSQGEAVADGQGTTLKTSALWEMCTHSVCSPSNLRQNTHS